MNKQCRVRLFSELATKQHLTRNQVIHPETRKPILENEGIIEADYVTEALENGEFLRVVTMARSKTRYR